jgi:hypothetical protein
MTDTLTAAQAYCRMGIALVPVPARQKEPVLKGWQMLRLAEADLPTHFSNGNNIGALCGVPSGGLVDVDLDVPEAAAAAVALLPPHPTDARAT